MWADCQNTLRALVLFRATQPEVEEIGYNYLNLDGDVEEAAREAWGFRPGARPKQLVLRDISRLLALTGPTVVAVDQIDGMLNLRSSDGTADAATVPKQTAMVGKIADGLMELRDATRRTLTIVACLPETWEMIAKKAAISAADRFRPALLQGAMPDVAVATGIVEQHLTGLYAEAGFTPPYPTWPVLHEAFERPGVRNLTPRKLLQRVDAHIRACLDSGQLGELADFAESPVRPVGGTGPGQDALRALDERFAQLRTAADVVSPLDQDAEDQRMPALLAAGLKAYIAEIGEAGQALAVDQVRGKRPALHARLRRTLDERTEDELHVAFRAIAHSHHRAVQSRLGAARTEAGLGAGADRRRLVLIRNEGWPSGPKTAAAVAEFQDLGGVAVPISEADLRTLSALESMQRPPLPGLLEWLAARKPAGSTVLFRRTLADLPGTTAPPAVVQRSPSDPAIAAPDSQVAGQAAAPPSARAPTEPHPRPRVPAVPVGRSAGSGQDVLVPLESLRKHAVVFAGSGSGKTVLLRRLVEECALRGVSAIVLDPNNDLARLGDPWPAPPDGWYEGDAARAEAYLAETDVAIWTPGRTKGRPLAFQPLPEFDCVLDDEDELRLAVDSAVAGLAPRAQLTPRKLGQGQAVLREALEHFARNGGSSLGAFVDFLADPPDGISGLRNG